MRCSSVHVGTCSLSGRVHRKPRPISRNSSYNLSALPSMLVLTDARIAWTITMPSAAFVQQGVVFRAPSCAFTQTSRTSLSGLRSRHIFPKNTQSVRRYPCVACLNKDKDEQPQHIAHVENTDSTDSIELSSSLDDEDRRCVDEITKESEDTLRQVGDAVRKDLDDLRSSTDAMADQLIEQETQTLLSKYDEQQEDLLETVKNERRNIQDEFDKISSISNNKGSLREMPKNSAAQLLFAASFLFGLASIVYAWNALVNSNQQALINALVDAVVAVGASFFANKYDSK